MVEPKPHILFVDDDPELVSRVAIWLRAEGYWITVTSSATEAREFLTGQSYDLVVSPLAMPGFAGTDAMAVTQASPEHGGLLLSITVDDREAVAPMLRAGAYGYVIKPLVRNDFLVQVANALERRGVQCARAKDADLPVPRERRETMEIMEREQEIVFRLMAALGVRSDETMQHVRRVGLNAALLAKHLGWNPDAVADIRLAAALHDIGEMGVPDSILLKPGKLSAEEFALIKKHAEIGASLLAGSRIPMLNMAEEIARCHHEKWDGTGYPKGLARTDIPESARIVAVVDVYDALVSERVYRPPLPLEEAYSIMLASRAKYFDPRIVDCFLRLLPEIELVRGTQLHEEDLAIDFDDTKSEGC